MSSTTNKLTSRTSSRRTVLRAAAWTAPAVSIAVAAPAYACSTPMTDVRGTVNWQTGYSLAATGIGRANAVMDNGSAFGVRVSTSFGGDMVAFNGTISYGNYSYYYENLKVSPHNIGGLQPLQRGLTLAQRRTNTQTTLSRDKHVQSVLLTFDAPVKDLRFTITDIDRLTNPNNHADRVFVTPTAADTFTADTVVQGDGTSGVPWKNADTLNNNLHPVTGSRGNVALYFGTTPSQTYTINFWNDNAQGGVQQIFLSNMSFSTSPSQCA